MTRTLSYTITDSLERTVTQYLRDHGYSHRIIARLKRQGGGRGGIVVNGEPVRADTVLLPGDLLTVTLEEKDGSTWKITPEDIPLDVLYEDDDIVVVNKPAGMPVHPSAGHHEGTLAGALYGRFRDDDTFLFRCINRLDKDTTGALICARNALSADILNADLKERRIRRTYQALVEGSIERPGEVCAPIGRLPGSALKRCVDMENGAYALTRYTPLAYCAAYDLTFLELHLETGRTHQIRVHMASIGHPLIGDWLYGHDGGADCGQNPGPGAAPGSALIARQALHSRSLSFHHPVTGLEMNFSAPLPEDMKRLLSGSCPGSLPSAAPF